MRKQFSLEEFEMEKTKVKPLVVKFIRGKTIEKDYHKKLVEASTNNKWSGCRIDSKTGNITMFFKPKEKENL
jgi:hypothetical protein